MEKKNILFRYSIFILSFYNYHYFLSIDLNAMLAVFKNYMRASVISVRERERERERERVGLGGGE